MSKVSSNTIFIIKDSLQSSISGKATFLDHVKVIFTEGITRYKVDFIEHQAAYYSEGNEFHQEPLPLPRIQFRSAFFSGEGVKKAIVDVQQKRIDYPTFLDRISEAGIKSYEVNIPEGEVIYQGEENQHRETFSTSFLGNKR